MRVMRRPRKAEIRGTKWLSLFGYFSVDLQAKTATFQSGMAEAAKSARGAFTDIKSGSGEVAKHVGTNMFASRHAVMAVSEAFGSTMPRAITALLVHIEPLGAALEAAFPFAAIALGAVLLIEHLSKLQAEGHQLTEDQIRFGTAVQTAFNTLDQRLLQSQVRTDELRNDHLGALHHQIQLINAQSLQELVHEFAEVAKAADTVFARLQNHWYAFGEGARGAKNAMDDFQVAYAALEAKGDKQGASKLLEGTLESAEKALVKLKEVTKAQEVVRALSGLPIGGAIAGAVSGAMSHGKEQEIAAQQKLVELLLAQQTVESKISTNTNKDADNLKLEAAKAANALSAEGARSAAEHRQKMGEIALAGEKAQSEAELAMRESTIAERLAVDERLATEEYRIQIAGNEALIAALDKGGKDYNNQLRGLQQKAEEMTAQHNVTLSTLEAKSKEAQYRFDLQALTQSESEKIEATDQGSRERLAAIDAALKEEQAKNLQNTAFYRDLQKSRIEVQRQIDTEAAKLAAEAGKEEAENVRRTGEIALASQREMAELANTLDRVSWQKRMAQDIAFARAEYALKIAEMEREEATLDRGAKEYLNKLREIQNKEKQLTQQHENEVGAIRARGQAKELTDQRQAMASMEQNFALGFMQVLGRHRSFASMMESASEQMSAHLISAAILSAQHLSDDKLDQAKAAARAGFTWGTKYGGPLAPVLAPTMAATFFAGVMAFERGGVVPGIGAGDTVPAMLTPGEGIIPGGTMDRLDKMSRGEMSGNTTHVHVRPTYNLQALDTAGMEKMLMKHNTTIQKHVTGELRKMNR